MSSDGAGLAGESKTRAAETQVPAARCCVTGYSETTMSSTRRFSKRPCGVALLAIGFDFP